MANIEVFEWKEGQLRPGTVRKHRHDCIEILEVPQDGLPAIGDVILIGNGRGENDPYRVLSCEFVWMRLRDDDPGAEAKYIKAWIHVRRLSSSEYQAEPDIVR